MAQNSTAEQTVEESARPEAALVATPATAQTRRLLSLVAGLWIGFALLYLGLDLVIGFAQVPPWLYYALNVLAGLGVLGLAWWPGAERVLGRAYMPLIIGVLAVPPLIATYAVLPPILFPQRGGPGPLLSAEGQVFRILPGALMVLVLTAWSYRWSQILLVTLGNAVLSAGLLLVTSPVALALPGGAGDPRPPPGPPGPPFQVAPGIAVFNELLVVGIQTICLLFVGYFLSLIMTWLRQQQAGTAEANRQLRRHAGTLESLTISRERNRMARELHDTLAHTLSGLTVQLETVKAYWAVNPEQAQMLLEKAEWTARTGLQETRAALMALRASPLEDLGLSLALRQLAEDGAARGHLALDLALPDPLPPLAADVEQCVYRVAQEAIANVVYHANAQGLRVELRAAPRLTRLVVNDDGIGFATPTAPVGHYGLAGMRERARLIGAHLAIASQPGGGTTVELRIPGGGDR